MPKIRAVDDAVAQADFDDDYADGVGVARGLSARAPLRETRDAEVRPETLHDASDTELVDMEWRRPTALDAPPPRPGYVQRWVRMQQGSNKDMLNWSNKFREGYQPRDPATLPQEFRHLKGSTEGLGGMIVVGGMVLCEIPEQRMVAKRKFIRGEVHKQELSVSAETDTVSREGAQIGAKPIVREETHAVSRGRRPSVALAE